MPGLPAQAGRRQDPPHDGTFTVTLTASDGVNAPVSDSARVRLRNAPPRPSITGPAPWSVHRAGTPVSLTAPFTDPGANDTHTCAIVWDDGRTDSFAAPGGGKVSARLTGTDFDLDATELEWLVITPDGKAAVKGKATVAGRSGYGFVLYGHDEPDRLRLVVWPLSQAPYPGGPPAYDNRRVDEFDIDRFDPQTVTGGNITVHH
ncbi:hypothetical protein [Nonomuraea sp. C10]|uniref:hypothetical protein n=1 Tax=Nonomuraea sp. C10 TaxID=2600577 RepID=UPI0011CE7682|nr:hypothetical protein [Nonomuraea sp. C10]TXK40057.1 hypothetical protein FR742_11070 [Nonomuraea sp. C10]